MRHRLDTLGLRCPLPVRLAARRVAQLAPGDELEIVGDDPVLGLDLAAWCFDSGHDLVSRDGEPPAEGPIVCLIRVVSKPAEGSAS